MNEIKKLTVAICGKSFSISTDEKEEHIFKAVDLVDSLIKNISAKTQLNNSDCTVSILAALQLAIDITRSKEEELLLNSRSKELADLLKSEI